MARKKAANPGTALIPAERIERSIFLIRGEKVLLDSDLAALYQGVVHRRFQQRLTTSPRGPHGKAQATW
jgi:hypothetical protein